MMLDLAIWGLSPTPFVILCFLLILCAVRMWTTRGRSRSLIVVSALALIAAVPAYQGIPIALTNAALKQLPTGASFFPVLRLGFYTPGDVQPFWYSPSSSACPLNAGAGDNGSQVQSVDNRCWLAPYPVTGWDVTQFGAVSSVSETTGTISLSTPTTLTTAGALDFKNGQGIFIFGAGAAGANLSATIVSGAGTTTLTITPAASTAVTNARTEHDDGPSMQAAFAAASASGGTGGTARIPSGYYYAPAGVTCPTNTLVKGANQNGTFIVAGGGNTAPIITAPNPGCFVRDLSVNGKGITGNASEPFGASFPAVLISSNTTWENVLVEGGTGIKCTGGESNWLQVSVILSYGDDFLAQGCSGWMRHVSLDQSAGTGVFPGSALTINAWAPTTVYSTLNTIVTNSGYYMQLSQTGTSGGSAPTIGNFGFLTVDGTARWKLIGPVPNTASVGGFAQQIDSGTTEMYEEQVDMTSPMGYGLGFTNTLGTSNGVYFRCSECIPSQTIQAAVIVTSGGALRLTDINVGSVISAAWGGIQTTVAFTGDLGVAGSTLAVMDYGILIANTSGTVNAHDNTISAKINALNSQPGVIGGFVWHDNILSTTTGYGIVVGTTNNNYDVHNNKCTGNCFLGVLNDTAEGTNAPTTSNN